MQKQEQNWHSISMLPMISTMISGQLQEAKDQYQNLLQAEPKPYVLNDEIVERTIRGMDKIHVKYPNKTITTN